MVYTRDKQFMRQSRALKLRARFFKKYFQRDLSLEISHLNICVVEYKKTGKMFICFQSPVSVLIYAILCPVN